MTRAIGVGLLILFSGASLLMGAAGPPRFQNYVAPFPQCGGDAAEPSIGVNRSTGKVMMQAGLETLQVTFDDATSPAMVQWNQVQPLTTSLLSLDPIGHVDSKTGRTFVSQLDAGCSITSYSTNDGGSWNLSVGCGIPAGLDHQTVGSGPYASTYPPISHPTYPNAVYYCSQTLLLATCSRSDNGGLFFGVGTPIYFLTQCAGRHGHVKVAPDGTVYVPNSACNGDQAVVVSQNNGASWSVRHIPGTGEGFSDPSVAIGANNTVYFAFEDADHHLKVAVSQNHGNTWSSINDVGSAAGIQNAVFPAIVAGDDDRAAVAFLGTTTPGNYESSNFTGTWYLYIASTFDRGNTWNLVNATPGDPVQYGSIAAGGALQPAARHLTADLTIPLLDRGDRNLLDFIGAAVDKRGRILVAYADGCVNECVTTPSSSLSRSAIGVIARQSGGKSLYSAADPKEPSKPKAPLLSGSRDGSGVHLFWEEPDDGGSPITGYKIYRAVGSGKFKQLQTVNAATHSFDDATAEDGVTYRYGIKATNAIGGSRYSNVVTE
jgi:hypothetical protein